MIPCCRAYGVGLIPWSPLEGGALAGLKKTNAGRRNKDENTLKRIEKLRPQIEQCEAFCKKLKEEPADVALAWLLHNPVVTSPIIGPRTLEHLTGSLRALELKLDAGTLKKLDEIWPGPGEAPQAYAW